MDQILVNSFTMPPQGQKFEWFYSKIMKVPEGVTEYDFDWEVQAGNMDMVAEKSIPQGSVGVQQNPSEKNPSEQNITLWQKNDSNNMADELDQNSVVFLFRRA